MDSDVYHFNADRLEREGVIIRSGLTPTDIMHLKGDFDKYDREAVEMIARYYKVCLESHPDVEELADDIYKEVIRKLYENVVRCLLEYDNPYYRRNGLDQGTINMINDDFERKYMGLESSMVTTNFSVNCSLIGLGGPIHIFLPKVAKLLGAKAVIPEYSKVANAIGAINGHVVVREKIEIKPVMSGGFDVYGKSRKRHFNHIEEAKEFAVDDLKEYTSQEAIRRGAVGEITHAVEVIDIHSSAKHDMKVYTGTDVMVSATGKIGF